MTRIRERIKDAAQRHTYQGADLSVP